LTTGSSVAAADQALDGEEVFSGLVTAWRLAGWPTRRSPLSVKATIEGVVRAPSEFSITRACAAVHDGDAGVGGAEVDADNFCHVHSFQGDVAVRVRRRPPDPHPPWSRTVRAVAAAAPFFAPLTPWGKPMSVRMTSAGKIRLVHSDRAGYRYEPRHPSGVAWPPIPREVLAIWRGLWFRRSAIPTAAS
jgi:alkylated DNA repair dioxygenase AlkB